MIKNCLIIFTIAIILLQIFTIANVNIVTAAENSNFIKTDNDSILEENLFANRVIAIILGILGILLIIVFSIF